MHPTATRTRTAAVAGTMPVRTEVNAYVVAAEARKAKHLAAIMRSNGVTFADAQTQVVRALVEELASATYDSRRYVGSSNLTWALVGVELEG